MTSLRSSCLHYTPILWLGTCTDELMDFTGHVKVIEPIQTNIYADAKLSVLSERIFGEKRCFVMVLNLLPYPAVHYSFIFPWRTWLVCSPLLHGVFDAWLCKKVNE